MFPVARAVLLSMRERDDFVCAENCAAEQVKTDCCHTPAVVSTLLTPLPVSCPLTTPHHYIYIYGSDQVSAMHPTSPPNYFVCVCVWGGGD